MTLPSIRSAAAPASIANDRLTQMRVRYMMILAGFSIIISGVGTIFLMFTSPETDGIRSTTTWGTVFYLLVSAGVIWLTRSGRLLIASLIMITLFIIASLVTPNQWVLLAGTMAVVSAATLSNFIVFAITNFAVLGSLGVRIAMDVAAGTFLFSTNTDLVALLTLLIISIAVRYFVQQTESASAESRASTALLQNISDIGDALARLLNVREVLPRAVEMIRDRLGFYHAQIFLIDETGTSARLAASTGSTGQRLFERQHSLPVGSKSVIGQVTATGQIVLARDTDPIYYRNELLPNTRAEVALPLFDGDKIIGALDVQSRRPDAFNAESVQALQVLANLLGTFIRNARLFEAQERNARDMKRLYLDTEASLRENQRLNQLLTRQGWQEYIGKRQIVGFTLDDEESTLNEENWSDAALRAAQTRQAIVDTEDNHLVAVPVMLGNEVIGAIEIEPSEESPEADVLEMARSVAQRLALTLDKARLFEESQEAAAAEQRINDIVARYQTIGSVDDLLKVTLAELSKSLGAQRGAIRLGAVEPLNGNDNGNGEAQA
ncbi:MAG: GAF domain-containing protein [Anaerolineae bacterium]|nr:GAF domain-containing protein [Anaerolineae bacterium]